MKNGKWKMENNLTIMGVALGFGSDPIQIPLNFRGAGAV
jgi:hypothetical protein